MNYTGSTNVFRIQVHKSCGVYQVRIGARNDAGTWTDSAWQNLVDGWNALEVDWQKGNDAGTYSLWIGGTLKTTLTGIDNNNQAVDFVRLRAQGVDTGTRGTIYFDDFESRRFSEIGLLPDPGIQNPTPTPVPGWDNVSYTYGDPDHVHAVTSLSNGSTYTYDSNGNQTCRYENRKYYKQEYNAENRLYQVTQRTGSCSGIFVAGYRSASSRCFRAASCFQSTHPPGDHSAINLPIRCD